MLNKPKFMSPSINMYGNSVIDMNSDVLPFSCVVDGNEAVTDFQIVVSRLKDNKVVFDTGMQKLLKPFFPVNNRNQNVIFKVDLREYVEVAKTNTSFVNSSDAYYWTIALKNEATGTKTYSSAEVFYVNATPVVDIQFQTNNDIDTDNYKDLNNNLVYNGETLQGLTGWEKNSNFAYFDKGGYLRLRAKTNFEDIQTCSYKFSTPVTSISDVPQIVYCSAQIKVDDRNSTNSAPVCRLGYKMNNSDYYHDLSTQGDDVIENDNIWHTMSGIYCTRDERKEEIEILSMSIGIDNASVNDRVEFKNVSVFNLTELYGSGNEPSKEWCDANIDSLRAITINTRKCKFRARYTQEQKISLKRYGWRLTDTTNNFVISDTITQNQIYGTEDDISCVCNGLVNGTSYLLETYIETQNGYFDVLKSVNFVVDYPTKNIEADFDIMALDSTSGIMLNWGNLRTTEGVVVGNEVSYKEKLPVQSSVSIEIPENTQVVFADTSSGKGLSIDENSYVMLSFQFNKSKSMILFEMSGTDDNFNGLERRLTYSASDKTLKYVVVKGNVISSHKISLSDTIGEMCWYVVTLYPLINGEAYCKLTESTAEGGLFPTSDNSEELLYPSEELYPDFGEWDAIRTEEVV